MTVRYFCVLLSLFKKDIEKPPKYSEAFSEGHRTTRTQKNANQVSFQLSMLATVFTVLLSSKVPLLSL